MALAGELHLVICIINLSDEDLSDTKLLTLMGVLTLPNLKCLMILRLLEA
jgi:hypothetical protein